MTEEERETWLKNLKPGDKVGLRFVGMTRFGSWYRGKLLGRREDKDILTFWEDIGAPWKKAPPPTDAEFLVVSNTGKKVWLNQQGKGTDEGGEFSTYIEPWTQAYQRKIKDFQDFQDIHLLRETFGSHGTYLKRSALSRLAKLLRHELAAQTLLKRKTP